MALDFPSPATNGTTYAPGPPALGSWVYDGTKWNSLTGTSNYVLKTGDTMTGALRVQTAGVVIGPAATATPGAGALTLNANTVAPPANTAISAPSINIVGSNGNNPAIVQDAFGTGVQGIWSSRRARGTAAAPTAVQNGDSLGIVAVQGYDGSAYNTFGHTMLNIVAVENWTTSAHGSNMTFATTPLGQNATVNSLSLQGNTATFSGTITAVGHGTHTLGSTSGAVDTNLAVQSASGQQAYVSLQSTRNWLVISATGGDYNVYDLTAPALRIAINSAGACSASSAWGVISDAGLKSDIEDHPHGLAEILQLQPRRFRMVDGDRIATGLIAQELEAVMPELVGEMATQDGGTVKTVTETGIIWPLVNAVKTLSQRLDALEHAAR